MKILYFSPRPFGLMATPGTYLTVEGYHKFSKLEAILGIPNQDDIIVRTPPSDIVIKELNYSSDEWLWECISIVKKKSPDLICIGNWPGSIEFIKAIYKLDPLLKIILELKSPLLLQGGPKKQKRMDKYDSITGMLSGVIALSEKVAKTWFSKITFPLETHTLLIDNEKILSKLHYHDFSTNIKFIFTGSLENKRKINTLIRYIADLPKNILKMSKFDFYGDGEDKDKLVILVNNLDLRKQVSFYGAINQDKLFSLYKHYDVGIAWVPFELYGAAPSLKLLEYCAAGIIPLATSTEGHLSFEKQGYSIEYFDDTSESFIQKVIGIHSMKSGLNFKDNVNNSKRSNYLKVIADKIIPFYQNICDNKAVIKIYDQSIIRKANIKNLNWFPSAKPFISRRDNASNISVSSIISERLYQGLNQEVKLTVLSENQFEYQLKENKIDFLLVESILFSVIDDWRFVFCEKNGILDNLFDILKDLNVPSVFWVTVDDDQVDQFKEVFDYFDYVFFADENSYIKYKAQSEKFHFLPPAIQPRKFNPISFLEASNKSVQRILINGINTPIHFSQLNDIAKANNEIDFSTFEYSHLPTNNNQKRNAKLCESISFQGKIPHSLIASVYKDSIITLTSYENRLTRTERLWRAMETAACQTITINISRYQVESNQIFSLLTEKNNSRISVDINEKEIQTELSLLFDQFNNGAINLKVWREVYSHHLLEYRIKSIANVLNIPLPSVKDYKISVVSPTVRAGNLHRILENYHNQSYENKELIIVINADRSDYLEVKEKVLGMIDIKVFHLCPSHYAATALNLAAKYSTGDYLFRFDDDDYYGAHYLSDSILMLKADEADVIGKFSLFVQYNDEKDVFLRNANNLNHTKNNKSFYGRDIGTKNSTFSGATFGVKLSLLKALPFPDISLAAADSAYLDLLAIYQPQAKILKTDWFNFTIGRQQESKHHTWQVPKRDLINLTYKVSFDNSEVPRDVIK